MKSFLRIICTILCIQASPASAQQIQELDNLVSFAKAYGYVKYFHPSSESVDVDWGWYSVYGAQQVRACANHDQLIQTLNRIFAPIAPAVKFTDSRNSSSTIPSPEEIEKYTPVFWQHYGVAKDMSINQDLYKSERVLTPTDEETLKKNAEKGKILFANSPASDPIWDRELIPGVWISMPLMLFEKDKQTFPKATEPKYNPDDFAELPTDASGLDFRLGNIINTWNVFQHFYPYFEEVPVDWSAELRTSLQASFTSESHLKDLREMTAKLQDGHLAVYGNESGYFAPPIDWEWIEGKLVITDIKKEGLQLQVGDIVTQINGKSAQDYFDTVSRGISAATPGFREYRSNFEALYGAKDSEIILEVNTKKHTLQRTLSPQARQELTRQKPDYLELENEIMYLNLDRISMSLINQLMPKLKNSKAIIADMRGYPNSNHDFILHLLRKSDNDHWMFVNQLVYPDQENIAGRQAKGWNMNPRKPYLGDKKIIFITDSRAVSYAESYMGFIEAHDLGMIIGQPTAGTNGNINRFYLPGEYVITFTGMRVLKHDGSHLHGVGILPDLYLEKTVEGVKAGRDEYLEKAIELAKTN